MNTITPKIHKENPPNTSQKQIYLLTIQIKVNNNMASAYRPRHKTNNNKNKYQHLYNWYPSTTTNDTPKYTTPAHYFPEQSISIIPALPNLFTTTKFTLIKYYKTIKKKPNCGRYCGYYFINKLALLQCGDIETNFGPMPDILRSHPTDHKKRA